MSERKRDALNAQPGGILSGFAMEFEGGLAGRQIGDLKILPGDAAPPAGADGLHPGFLGGKAGVVRKLADALISTKGVKHGRLTITVAGGEL